jgi:hypothetical protein
MISNDIKIEVDKIDLEIDKLNEVIGRLRTLKNELLETVIIEKSCNYCIDKDNLTGSQKCGECIEYSNFRISILT